MRAAKGYPIGMLVVCVAMAACIGTASADWVTTTVAAGRGPWAVTLNPVTNKIYVANLGSDNVTVIDGATNGTLTVDVGDSPVAVAVNPVTNKVYVANQGSDNVTVIDGTTNTTTTVPTDSGPCAVAVNPVTNKIYVANGSSNSVTVIDGATNDTAAAAAGARPIAVAVNPLTNKIYIANYNSNDVTVIDGATNATTTVATGRYPCAVSVNPVSNRIYVVNHGAEGDVTAITNAPVRDTKVHAAFDRLPGDTTSLARPVLTGKGVNRSSPNSTGMMGVGNHLSTAQQAWDWATVTSGAGTDSITWTYSWGTDSLLPGENFVCCVPLEDEAAVTNNLGLGTPFAGNLEVYPVYRVGFAGGVEEGHKPRAPSSKLEPTVVRGVLFLPGDRRPGTGDRAALLDISGRKVLDLKPGSNDVRALAPGVYFVIEAQAQAQAQAIRKVVVTR